MTVAAVLVRVRGGTHRVREIAVGPITVRVQARETSELADALDVMARSHRMNADRLDVELPTVEYSRSSCALVLGGLRRELGRRRVLGRHPSFGEGQPRKVRANGKLEERVES